MLKKIMCLLMAAVIALLCLGCSSAPKQVPKGYEKAAEYRDPDGFGDYVDYCKYFYKDADAVKKDSRYSVVSEADVENILAYFSDFSEWMNAERRDGDFDFSPDCVNAGDYVCIETKEGQPIGGGAYGKFDNYTVCLFDTESLTLYYIHANI